MVPLEALIEFLVVLVVEGMGYEPGCKEVEVFQYHIVALILGEEVVHLLTSLVAEEAVVAVEDLE